ncbi:hypothetical protein Leryth_027552 [Lithospermum erythrorhizon]|nr:hypothetical protein Leryth_027552 [Lithospermum erythrorhizon]
MGWAGSRVERHILQSRHHSASTEVVSFQTLKSRIVSQDRTCTSLDLGGGVNDNDDRNFKHIRTKEPPVADGPLVKGDLLPTIQTLNAVEDVQGHDLGHQRSCYGDSCDVVDQKSDANSSGLKFVELCLDLLEHDIISLGAEPSIFEGASFVENMAQIFANATWEKLCEKLMTKSLVGVDHGG